MAILKVMVRYAILALVTLVNPCILLSTFAWCEVSVPIKKLSSETNFIFGIMDR